MHQRSTTLRERRPPRACSVVSSRRGRSRARRGARQGRWLRASSALSSSSYSSSSYSSAPMRSYAAPARTVVIRQPTRALLRRRRRAGRRAPAERSRLRPARGGHGSWLASTLGGEEREGAQRRRRSGGLALYAQELADVKSLMRTLEKDFDASRAPVQRPVSGQYTGRFAEDDKGDQAVVSNLKFGADGSITGDGIDGIDGAYTLSGRWAATAARGSSATRTASRSPSLVLWSGVATSSSSSARRAAFLGPRTSSCGRPRDRLLCAFPVPFPHAAVDATTDGRRSIDRIVSARIAPRFFGEHSSLFLANVRKLWRPPRCASRCWRPRRLRSPHARVALA